MRCLRCFLIVERPCQGVIISKGARMPHTSWSGVAACLCFQRCCGHRPISRPPACGRAAAVPAGSCLQLENASHVAQRSRQWDLSLPKGKALFACSQDLGELCSAGSSLGCFSQGGQLALPEPPQSPSSVPLCCKVELVP